MSYVGDPNRFDHLYQVLAEHLPGMARDDPSYQAELKQGSEGMPMTKAGPNLVKKYAFLSAEVARQWDPQIARIYWDQMVNKGKHHTQAVCACATHLLDRLLAVLKEGRPYELRDCHGNQVTTAEARRIIQERYKVPEEVRRSSQPETHER